LLLSYFKKNFSQNKIYYQVLLKNKGYCKKWQHLSHLFEIPHRAGIRHFLSKRTYFVLYPIFPCSGEKLRNLHKTTWKATENKENSKNKEKIRE
jgi:hypothetical protein